LFAAVRINIDFHLQDPTMWNSNDRYRDAVTQVVALKVVNNAAKSNNKELHFHSEKSGEAVLSSLKAIYIANCGESIQKNFNANKQQ
jgi:hypothetical protein